MIGFRRYTCENLNDSIAKNILSIAVIIMSGSMASGQTSQPNPSTRPVPNTQWTPIAICHALAWREGKLQNCSFVFTEDRRLFHPGVPGEKLLNTDQIIVKRKNGAIWLDVSEQDFTDARLSFEHSIQSWDGSQCRWLERDVPKPPATQHKLRGGVNGTEPHVLYLVNYFSIIGLRQFEENPWPWSKMIQNMMAVKGSHLEVSEFQDDKEHYVKLVVSPTSEDPTESTFVFLPDKDFAISDFRLVYPKENGRPSKSGENYHVVRHQQFDNFWMPAEVSVTVTVQDNGNTIQYLLKSFSLTPPAQDEMKVEFPVGCRVMDNVQMLNYTILPNGQRTYQDFYDANTGKIISAAQQAAREAATTQKTASPTTMPTGK